MRIICQCNQADFAEIKKMANALSNPSDFDLEVLSRTQQYAFRFIVAALKRNISWSLIKAVVKEVLFWGWNEDDEKYRLEVKFVRDPAKKREIEEFRKMWV